MTYLVPGGLLCAMHGVRDRVGTHQEKARVSVLICERSHRGEF